MSSENQGVVLQSSMKPQTGTGTLYVAVDKEFLKNHNIDPDSGKGVPDEIVTQYHKGGTRDGEFTINLRDHVR